MPKRDDYAVPAKMQTSFDTVVELTDAFCRAHLTAEYADLCRRLAAKLARKRPSPLAGGRAKSWAGGILYTIARVNFLFDPRQTPHLQAGELCKLMGVSRGTASGKSTDIMRMLKITQLDPAWTLPGLLAGHPFTLMMTDDGLIIDAPRMTPEILAGLRRLGFDIDLLDD
jgi:hypothetical protein